MNPLSLIRAVRAIRVLSVLSGFALMESALMESHCKVRRVLLRSP